MLIVKGTCGASLSERFQHRHGAGSHQEARAEEKEEVAAKEEVMEEREEYLQISNRPTLKHTQQIGTG